MNRCLQGKIVIVYSIYIRKYSIRKHPSKHLLVFKTFSRRLQDMSSRRSQCVFSVTILRLSRRLADILQRYLEDVLKTS